MPLGRSRDLSEDQLFVELPDVKARHIFQLFSYNKEFGVRATGQ